MTVVLVVMYLELRFHHDAAIGVGTLSSSAGEHASSDPTDQHTSPSSALASLGISDRPHPLSRHQHCCACNTVTIVHPSTVLY